MAPASAANLTAGYTIGAASQLLTANSGAGSTLFNDSAALGGSDASSTTGTINQGFSVLLDGLGKWSVGDTVTITGLALPLIDAATDAGTFTFDIRQGAGGTGTAAVGGLASIGTATANFADGGGSSAYYVNFDIPVTFVADANSTRIVINWSSTAAMRWKKETTPGGGRLLQVNYSTGDYVGGDDSVRFSVAGSVVPSLDSDSDGLSDLAETGGDYAGGAGTLGTYNGPGDTGTFYNNPDSDGDGIPDGQEVNGETTSGNNYTSNPTLVDTDNDSIEDGDEVDGSLNAAFSNQPTNPGNRDTDNDGLGDKYELNNGLDPRTNADFDSDTFSDRLEVMFYGSDPKLSGSFPGDGTHPAPGSFPAIVDSGVSSNLDIPSTLGSTIINEAVTGGSYNGDYSTGVTNFVLHFANAFPAAGSQVSISGFAWTVSNNDTYFPGDTLLEFYDPGADGVVDGVDKDTLVGTARGTLTTQFTSVRIGYFNFTPVNFISSGTGLVVKIQSTSRMRMKAGNNFGSGLWLANNGSATFGTVLASPVSIGGSIGGYSSWKTANNTAGNLDEDHDGDGVKNGIEYFLGGGTDTTGFTPLPGVTNTGGTLSTTWTKAADYNGTYGPDFVVETSATLAAGSWIPAAQGAGPNQVEITGDDVKFTFPSATKNFARLKVTGP